MKLLSLTQIQAISGGTWQDAAINGVATWGMTATGVSFTQIVGVSSFMAGITCILIAQKTNLEKSNVGFTVFGMGLNAGYSYLFGGCAPDAQPTPVTSDKHRCITDDCSI